MVESLLPVYPPNRHLLSAVGDLSGAAPTSARVEPPLGGVRTKPECVVESIDSLLTSPSRIQARSNDGVGTLEGLATPRGASNNTRPARVPRARLSNRHRLGRVWIPGCYPAKLRISQMDQEDSCERLERLFPAVRRKGPSTGMGDSPYCRHILPRRPPRGLRWGDSEQSRNVLWNQQIAS